MSIIIGAFVAFCSIASSLTVITDWVHEDETPINVAPLNFSASLLNKDAESNLPYTRMGSDEALDFWPEVEEGEVEELTFVVVAEEEENNDLWAEAVSFLWSSGMDKPAELLEADRRALQAADAQWLYERINLS